MPKGKRSSGEKKKDPDLDCPYILTRAQKLRRKRLLRDGWEPADLALARERHSRGARLRSRNRDEAGPADNPAVAVVVAVAEMDEENVVEPPEVVAPQRDEAAPIADAVPSDSNAAEAAATDNQAESTGTGPDQDQANASAGLDEGQAEEPIIINADPRPLATPPITIDINEYLLVDEEPAANSDEPMNNLELTLDSAPAVGASIGHMSVSSMINTTSIELDFGEVSAPSAPSAPPAPDVCSSVNESSVDTSTMDSDADSI